MSACIYPRSQSERDNNAETPHHTSRLQGVFHTYTAQPTLTSAATRSDRAFSIDRLAVRATI